MFIAFLSSQLVVLWKPGITRCSRVRVWTIESISSSRVRSLFTDGDLKIWFTGLSFVPLDASMRKHAIIYRCLFGCMHVWVWVCPVKAAIQFDPQSWNLAPADCKAKLSSPYPQPQGPKTGARGPYSPNGAFLWFHNFTKQKLKGNPEIGGTC